MRSPSRWLPFVFVLVGACTPPSTTGDNGADAGRGDVGCERNIECGAGRVCEKEPGALTGECVTSDCFTPDDAGFCGEGCSCDVMRGICACPPPCVPSMNEACDEGELCSMERGTASCVPVDQLPAANACEAWPSVAHVRAGGSASVALLGVDAGGHPVPHGVCSLPVTTDDVSCEQDVCVATAQASSCGRGECSVERRIYGALAANDARVVVVEEGRGAPLGGVRVLLRSGALVLEASTDASGVARFADAGPLDSVTVLPRDHEWHTLVGDARDVLIVTRRVSPADVIAAANATFDFQDVLTLGDVKIAGGGVSLADLSRLSVPALFGGLESTPLVLEGVSDGEELIELPWGSVFELSNEEVKGDALFVGAEGPRIPWAVGGRVRLSEIGELVQAQSAAGAELFPLVDLLELMTAFGNADHAIASVVELQARPLLGEVRRPYGDLASVLLQGADSMKPDTRAVSVTVTAPRLPCPPSSPACADDGTEGELLIALLASVPGRGNVPLGFVVGRDVHPGSSQTLKDGLVEGRFQSPAEEPLPAGVVSLGTAPPHDGLEGSPLLLSAFSMGPTIANVPSVTGALLRMTTVPESASFPPELLPYPRAIVADETVTIDDVGAQLTRLELHGEGDVRWHIWLPRETGTIKLAELLPDDATAPLGDVALSAFVLDDETLTPASLFDLGRGGASSWQGQLRAWSTVGCGADSSCVLE